jgi:hypothetical protein
MSAADDKTFDVRTLERKLRRGLISRKDYEKYLKGLPDRGENVTHVGVSLLGDFDDADDLDDDDEDDEDDAPDEK